MAGALRINPPAAIDTLFNRIARREALPAGPVIDFDMALPSLQFQVESRSSERLAKANIIYGSVKIPAAVNAAA